MASLRIGYNLFKGATQGGTDSSTPGVIQIETAKALKYKLRVQRLSDNKYWDTSTPGWETSAPAEADELDFVGSDSQSSNWGAIRRCAMRLSDTILAGIDGDGVIITAYASGDTIGTDGIPMTLSYELVTS